MSAAVLKARQDIGEKLPTTRVWPSINWQFPASPRTTPLLAQMAPTTERSDQQKSQHYWYRPPNRQALTFFAYAKGASTISSVSQIPHLGNPLSFCYLKGLTR